MRHSHAHTLADHAPSILSHAPLRRPVSLGGRRTSCFRTSCFLPGCRPAMAARGLPKAQYLQRYLSGPPAAQPRRRRRKKPPGAARTG